MSWNDMWHCPIGHDQVHSFPVRSLNTGIEQHHSWSMIRRTRSGALDAISEARRLISLLAWKDARWGRRFKNFYNSNFLYMRILQFNDEQDLPSLTTKMKKITREEDYTTAYSLKDTFFGLCVGNDGWGLSANQVWLNLRFFVIYTPNLRELFINPVLIKGHGNLIPSKEWCLSFANGEKRFTKRYKMIDVTYEDVDRVKYSTRLTWLEAVVFQHELDHMNGIII